MCDNDINDDDESLICDEGATIIVELKSGVILKAEYRGGNENKMHLISTTDLIRNEDIPGFIILRRKEIEAVRVLSNCTIRRPKVISLSESEFMRLNEMCNNYVYMATIDERFIKATEHLLNCENVGVVAVGSETGRNHQAVLLIMCSWDQAYIFDIFVFQQSKFPKELKEILSSKYVKKVVHDSATLVDCLSHQHKVELTNIFDTAVADLIIRGRNNGELPKKVRELQECLHQYLNFPLALLDSKLKMDANKWRKRPLELLDRSKYVRYAVYLITLKNYLEKQLLSDYDKKLNEYLSE